MQKQINLQKNNLNPISLAVAMALLFVVAWGLIDYFSQPHAITSTKTNSVSAVTVDKGTMGLLKQIALHLSKMKAGRSVGGFPGFEPPDDDEAYKRKVKDEQYTNQDVNDWVKEINNFLRQIIKKNPNLTLEQILQKAGLSQAEIIDFIKTLKDVQVIAKTAEGYGVTTETITILENIMKTLGVAKWIW